VQRSARGGTRSSVIPSLEFGPSNLRGAEAKRTRLRGGRRRRSGSRRGAVVAGGRGGVGVGGGGGVGSGGEAMMIDWFHFPHF
jgi:hypothetical protein